MLLTCYTVAGPVEIRPAPHTRVWMDQTPGAYAYRCLPLSIANSHGWELLLPRRLTASWSGGHAIGDVEVEGTRHASSHFGSGVLTFHTHAVFRTEPGFDLFVTGPLNDPKHGIAPLTGLVETDTAHASFTMNWKFTAPGVVTFQKGEPFCLIFPIFRDHIGDFDPEFRLLQDDTELAGQYWSWAQSRLKFNANLTVLGSEEQKAKWQKDYFRAAQRSKLRLRPFRG